MSLVHADGLYKYTVQLMYQQLTSMQSDCSVPGHVPSRQWLRKVCYMGLQNWTNVLVKPTAGSPQEDGLRTRAVPYLYLVEVRIASG